MSMLEQEAAGSSEEAENESVGLVEEYWPAGLLGDEDYFSEDEEYDEQEEVEEDVVDQFGPSLPMTAFTSVGQAQQPAIGTVNDGNLIDLGPNEEGLPNPGGSQWGPAALQNHFERRRKVNEQELEMALNDLLISIYSQRPESEYQAHYFELIEKLHWQNNHVYQSINSQLGEILKDIGSAKRVDGALPPAERGTKATLILGFFLMKIKSIMV